MKYLLFFLSPILLFCNEITISVEKIKPSVGSLFIGLYKESNNFAEIENVYRSTILDVKNKSRLISTFNIQKGTYAISIFHDENNNGKLDTNFFGVPKEGFGFSNNPKVNFSKPTFKECSFELNNNKIITINMEY